MVESFSWLMMTRDEDGDEDEDEDEDDEEDDDEEDDEVDDEDSKVLVDVFVIFAVLEWPGSHWFVYASCCRA